MSFECSDKFLDNVTPGLELIMIIMDTRPISVVDKFKNCFTANKCTNLQLSSVYSKQTRGLAVIIQLERLGNGNSQWLRPLLC